ncbi:VOC family protein [Lentzea jiangxiensis]|uniref:Catechol 2,3-dioxygenase n=1 Tax=Lentzea jiangxiensis TaxID=641025 RepID=A0A1H0X6Q0_9PSEU|nr:VOC family protein [Lentzea jiangxiensis]SDP98628.1 Catechol 2,3-dioxygenase [Lentzea jiangxiensis]
MRLTSVTVGTSRPQALAAFYARLLGGTVETADEGWALVRTPGGLSLGFEFERHFRRPVWPARAGAQTASQHLDVQVDDLDAAVEHALACGAVLAEVQPQDDVRVLFDPDGHPFCLFLD